MKKSDLVAHVAEKAELSKAAATRAIHALFDGTTGAIAQAVQAGEQVTIPGFGRFRPKVRKARKGRNPQTGAEIEIPERQTVQFSAGSELKNSLANEGSEKPRARKAGGGAAKRGSAAKSAGSAAAGKSARPTRGGASTTRGSAAKGGAASSSAAKPKSGATGAAKGGRSAGGAAKKPQGNRTGATRGGK